MPLRPDIRSVLVIGSGPIVIGQAYKFNYSGTQACRVLRGEGIRVILVNSNPATIMTDPDMADATYIEHPELGINVVDLGLLYGVTIEPDGTIVLDMTLTTTAWPLAR